MAHFRKLAVFVLLTAIATSSQAMDLTQAYLAALWQDANILAARSKADADRERLPQARAALMPNLSFSMVRNRNDLSSTVLNAEGQPFTSDASFPSSNSTLTLRQPLYRKYQWANFQQAQELVDDTNAVLEAQLQDLTIKVSGSYFEAILAEEHRSLVSALRENYTIQLEAARKTFEAGTGVRTDIDEAQARLDMVVAQELEARQNVEYTRQQLRLLVNQPIDTLAALDPELLELAPPQPNRLQDWVERAEQTSPSLKALRARLAATQLEVEKARAGHYPTLDLVAQWTRSSSENSLNYEASYNNRAIGVQLNVPLFAGGSVDSAVRQALAGREQARYVLEAARRELAVRVHSEFRGVTEGVLRVRALEQAVRSARQALVSSQKSFAAGSRTRVDVLNAESESTSASFELAKARYRFVLSRLRLQNMIGAADIDAIEAVNRWLRP